MNQSEENIKNSFTKVKVDITSLKDQLVSVTEGQEKLMAIIDELKSEVSKKKTTPEENAKKVAEKKVAKKKTSKKGKKLNVL